MKLKNIKKIVSILILFSLVSCVTQKACDKKFPPQTREIITYKDSTIIKDSIRVQIKDSLKIKDSIVYKSPSEGETEFEDTGKDFKHTFKEDGNQFTVIRSNGRFKLTYKLTGTISRFNSIEKTKDIEILQLKKELQKSKENKQKTDVIVKVVTIYPWWLKTLLVFTAILLIPHIWNFFVKFVVKRL